MEAMEAASISKLYAVRHPFISSLRGGSFALEGEGTAKAVPNRGQGEKTW